MIATVPAPATARKYKAFISYSHAADDRLAPALQSALQQFAKPWYRLRAIRVFRDKTGLAVTPELWGSIQRALEDSEFFVLLASPRAAQSKWIEQEVDWWLRHRSSGSLLIVWTDGELAWDRPTGDFDWSRTTALPRRLKGAFSEEPNHLDMRFVRSTEHLSVRHPQFFEAIASLSATLQGRSLDEILGEDVSQHKRTMRMLRIVALGAAILTVAAGFAVFMARDARRTAVTVAEGIESVAQQQEREAMSREVASRSLAVLDGSRELALLLAMEAACVHSGEEALSALRQSLSHNLQPRTTFPGHVGGAYFAAFTPDSRRVITGGADHAARLWDWNSGKMALELRGHSQDVTGGSVTSDGKRIVTSSRYDHTAKVWDGESGKHLFDIEHKGLTAVRLSPDGKYILTLAHQNDAVLWDAGSGQRLRTVASAYAQFRGASVLITAAFSPGGDRIAMIDWRPAVCEVTTGKVLFELDGHNGQVNDIDYSPNGELLVTASDDRTARIWRASSGKNTGTLAHETTVLMAQFSPRGRWIVTGDANRVIRIWDAASQRLASEIDVRPKELTAFRISPDEDFLVTISEQALDVFETRSGAKVAELMGHKGLPRDAAFSPDGQRIVTVSLGGEVNLYAFPLGVPAKQLLELARQRVSRKMTPEERTQHLPPRFPGLSPECP